MRLARAIKPAKFHFFTKINFRHLYIFQLYRAGTSWNKCMARSTSIRFKCANLANQKGYNKVLHICMIDGGSYAVIITGLFVVWHAIFTNFVYRRRHKFSHSICIMYMYVHFTLAWHKMSDCFTIVIKQYFLDILRYFLLNLTKI